MDQGTRVYGDDHVEVFRKGGDAPGEEAGSALFYRIRAGGLELTYDVLARAWYVYMPGRERMQLPVSTHPYYLSEQGFTMVNIDWDRTETQVYGIEIIGGDARGDLVVIDVPEPAEKPAGERGKHLRVIRSDDR